MSTIKDNAWISPSGQIFWVGYQQHSKWASDYLKKKYGPDNFTDKIEEICESVLGASSSDALHRLGWVRLMTWTAGKTRVYNEDVAPDLTRKQKETLEEWCVENNYNFDDLLLP